jgi:2-polyprenyl-6-methoxyphenol hydroxylase-like FAD-dependent oxidoreductase
MFNCNKYDVLVVGARCAGAATAMLMARHGMNVLAIDRGAYGSDTISTHALMRGGVLQLHRWGLLPRIIAAGTPAIRTTTFHYGKEISEVAIKPIQGVEALCAPRRTVLDAVLVDAAREAGADVRHGYLLTSLRQRPDGRVAGAVVVDPNGNRHEITADLVIGADGIGSRVAQLAGAAVLREATCSSAVIYGHWNGMESSGYRWHYAPGASAGVIPTSNGRHCVFAAVPASRFRAEIRQDPIGGYRRVLVEAAPGLADTMAASALENRLWVFAGRKGYMRQACGPGWALVGDAGYFKDPLTAHGITDALRDAALLAEAAASGTDAGLAAYAATLEALSLPLFTVTDAIASFQWDIETVQRHHHALNTAMKSEIEHLASLRVPAARATCPIQEQEKAA